MWHYECLQPHHYGDQRAHNTLRTDYAHSLFDPSLQVAITWQPIHLQQQNKKQMPYSQYLCNFTQLYIGACVVYVITLTNEVQPSLPGRYR